MSKYKLADEIVRLSNADNWDEAKLEWKLDAVVTLDEPGTCLCGHFPIVELCIIRNKINSLPAEVGNICVKKFLGLPSEKIFQGIRRITKDENKALNAQAIDYAHRRGWIDNWERGFYFDTMRKRSLFSKQLTTRQKINRRVLAKTRRAR